MPNSLLAGRSVKADSLCIWRGHVGRCAWDGILVLFSVTRSGCSGRRSGCSGHRSGCSVRASPVLLVRSALVCSCSLSWLLVPRLLCLLLCLLLRLRGRLPLMLLSQLSMHRAATASRALSIQAPAIARGSTATVMRTATIMRGCL